MSASCILPRDLYINTVRNNFPIYQVWKMKPIEGKELAQGHSGLSKSKALSLMEMMTKMHKIL